MATSETVKSENDTEQDNSGQQPSTGLDSKHVETAQRISEITKEISYPTIEPSAKRSQKTGNDYPVAPEDRTLAAENRSNLDAAAGHLAAATAALTTHDQAEERLNSDPRRERDLKVQELGMQGKLGAVPPSEFEQDIRGVEDVDSAPATTDEQVADDTKRLEQAENSTNSGVTTSGNASTTTGTSTPIK